ncbi:MAG TPA: DUF3606 domain-containing protein [Solimonas sp.]|nr:DUF3606 domain-containing protein [Solimonas sp.]
MNSDDNRFERQADRQVSVGQGEEFRGWCRNLGCSEKELREALSAVGRSAESVSEYLLREPA